MIKSSLVFSFTCFDFTSKLYHSIASVLDVVKQVDECEPLKCGMLRGMFKAVRPGWHMNKDHWISVDLMGDMPEEILCRLTRDSHALTAPRMRKGRKLSGEPVEGIWIVHPDRQKP